MNTQVKTAGPGSRRARLEVLAGGRVLPLGDAGGKLEVLHGRVWLTRAGDPDDHFVERVAAAVQAVTGRCWEIVDPAPRIGAGALAAVAAVLAGALVFGPFSDARTRTLARPLVLHNGGAANAHVDVRTFANRPRADAHSGAGERPVGAAQEAGRCAPGVA